jgi:hypothetical protein
MIVFSDIDFDEDDYYETDLSELDGTVFNDMPENFSIHLLADNFPECYITRKGDVLKIQIEEHIYTKYWFHKFHASVFADAMIKAIKRLTAEGMTFSDEELEEDDDVHLFVRWTLNEPITIDSNTLKTHIDLAFDYVFERANSMLENSDSILILGKDTGEGMDLLKRIQSYLSDLGYYTYIIKELPDKIGESVIQKVLRYGLSSRFLIIENSEPTGHLYEFPHVAKVAELTCVILQREGQGATWMFEDLYHRMNNIKKFEYTNDNFEGQIQEGINWANSYLKSFGDYQRQKLPWFK